MVLQVHLFSRQETQLAKRCKKVIASVTLALFIAQPILVAAQPVADPNAGSNKPIVETAASGKPVVQIATPSAAGVSRNQYLQFNVDSLGLILNNSRGITQTQLAGYIQGNPNLANGTARIILNEVTGTGKSYLNGWIEVAGNRADVIIANPNGIIGNGFGFINTNRAVLTTGIPIFGGAGSLEAFRVAGGQISIEGAGLNAANIDRVDIISRAVSVNAGIWANNLNVVTGNNRVDYNTLNAQKNSDDGNALAVSLDVGQLGGMYANKIKLVGTENGVGVNSQGTISASGGDLELTQDGKIVNAGQLSANNIQITAMDRYTNQGMVYTQGNITVNAASIDNSGVMAAGQNTFLSGQTVSTTGVLGAGIQSDGTTGSSGNLNIIATGAVTAQGQNLAGGNLIIIGSSINQRGAATYVSGTASLTAINGDINHTGATMQIGGPLTISAVGAVINNQDITGKAAQIQAGTVNITGNTISNQGGSILQTSTDQMNLTARGSLNNSGGSLASNGVTNLSVGDLLNQGGRIQVSGPSTDLGITASGAIDNSQGGVVAASGSNTITANSLINSQGQITAGQELNLGLNQDLINTQGQLAANQNVNASGNWINNQQGIIGSVQGQTRLNAITGALNNTSGRIEAAQSVDLSAVGLNNTDGVIMGDSLSANSNAQKLDNTRGKLLATGGRVNLQSGVFNNEAGFIQGTDAVTIDTHGQTLNNINAGSNGGIVSQGTVNLITGDLNNQAGYVQSGNALTIQGAAIDNSQSGVMVSGAQLNMGANTLNNQSGQIQAGTVSITGNTIINQGGSILQTGTDQMTLTASGSLNNNGGTIASNGVTNLSVGDLINQVGRIQVSGPSTADLSITASGTVDNSQAGVVAASGNNTITANSLINRQGQITAGQELNLGIRQDLINAQGQLAANQNVNASGNWINNQQGIIGSVQGQTRLNAITGVLDNTAGRIEAAQTVDLSAIGLNNTDGVIMGDSLNANSNVQKLDNTRGKLLATGGRVNLQSGAFNNEAGLIQGTGAVAIDTHGQTLNNINAGTNGGIVSQGTVNLITGDLNNQAGYVQSGNELTLQGAAIDNSQNGIMVSGAQLNMGANTLNNQNGQIQASTVSITGNTISNQGGSILQTGTDQMTLTASGSLNNSGGTLASNGAAKLSVGDLINQGGRIQVSGPATADLGIAASGTVDNSQGGVVAASGNNTITANSLINSQGQVTAGQELNLSIRQDLINVQGQLAANRNINASGNWINNQQGIIGSVQGQTRLNATAGVLDNTDGRIEAAQAVDLSAMGLNNTDGVILGDSLNANSNAQKLDNTRGKLLATGGRVNLLSGAFNNEAGLIQGTGAVAINTHGQTLNNINAGSNGGIVSQGTVNLITGDLNNQAGYVQSGNELTLQGAAIDNSQSGVIVSGTQLNMGANTLNNQNGQIQALGNVGINLSGTFNNMGSLVRSGQTLSVSADAIVNTNTQGDNQGIEGQSVSLTFSQINNQQGVVRANNSLILTGNGLIDNTQGLISSGQTLTLQDTNLANKTLLINNTGGTLIAGQRLDVDSAGLLGNGKLLSQGDLGVKLTQNYTHTGELQANGNVRLEIAGTLANQSTLLAGRNLDINASNLENTAGSEIKAQNTTIAVTGTLTNRGLIDGSGTLVKADTLTNLGTGRIYGDNLAIQSSLLNNDVETGLAPVIAARERLDIGAQTIANREHALIFSAGDMLIGGSLDTNKQAIGQATTLNNNSATIEALGNLNLAARQINNTNEHFSTSVQTTNTEYLVEYQGSGSAKRYVPGTPNVYIYNDESDYLHTPEGNYENWMAYRYTRTTTETKIQSSDPGQILSGNAMQIQADTLTNDKSRIMAGGTISGSIGTLNNTEVPGKRTITDTGTVTSYWRHHRSGRDNTGSSTSSYKPPTTIQEISLTPTVYQENTAPTGTGTQVAALSSSDVNQAPTGANAASVTSNSGSTTSPITQVATLAGVNGANLASNSGSTTSPITQVTTLTGVNGANMTNNSGSAISPITQVTALTGGVVRSGGVNTSVSNNSLFSVTPPNSNAHYLVETDPHFTDYRTWLSSDYMLQALNLDPGAVQKRLGDGFYEQKLIREQVTQLTGQRFLDGYNNDEAQYLALMNNTATFAKEHQLTVGVALTADQMAQLTSNIVWLVEKDITLPNGQTTHALVPQLYVRGLQAGDLLASGALISGNNIQFDLKGDLTNSGTIAGRNVVAITAQNIRNLGGDINGTDVSLQARTDLDNLGGRIQAVNSLTVSAGRDMNIASTTSTQNNSQGSRTTIDRVAGLYVTGGQGLLTASAGRDLTLLAAQIRNNGQNGDTNLLAGHNLNLGTVTESQSNHIVWDIKNQRSDSSRSDAGTTIQTQGNIRLKAGNDLNAKAAGVESSQGTLLVTAGRDVNLTTGETNQNVDEAHQHKGRSGMFSSTTYTTRDLLSNTTTQATTLSGDAITVLAGQNLTIQGSNLAGTHDVTLTAKDNLTITSAQETSSSEHYHSEKTSGLFGGGGLGFTIGSRSQKDTLDQQQITQVGSTVGSINGNVNITSGKDIHIMASDLISGKDTNLFGQNVTIESGNNLDQQKQTYEVKQSGLSVSIGSPAIEAVTQIAGNVERSRQVEDPRLKALYDYRAGKAINDNADTLKNIGQKADSNKLSVSISIGSSSQRSESDSQTSTAQQSQITAGGNVNITASGTGMKNDQGQPQDGDITVKGSKIEGQNISLNASRNINLESAANTTNTTTSTSGKSAGLGITFSPSGSGIFLEGTKTKGNSNGDTQTHTQAQIIASKLLTTQSGQDTNLIGVKVLGDTINMTVGGNLNLQSQQDIDLYHETNQSISGKIGIGTGLDLSMGRDKINSNYQSVNNQTGIYAGKGGFDITVGKNTDLKGAVISSDATPDKNRLSTDTLTYSDIENKADYNANSVGFNVKTSENAKYYEKGIVPNIGMPVEGDANSITKSVISKGSIEVRSNPNQDLSGLSRNPDKALATLGKIFDKKTVQERQELVKVFGEEAFKAVGDLAESMWKRTSDPREKAKWEEGGEYKVLLHTVVGGIMSNLAGNGLTSGAIGSGFSQFVQKQLANITNPNLRLMASSLVGATAAKLIGENARVGASSAFNGILYNSYHHRTYQEGEIVNKDGKWFIRKNGKDVPIDRPNLWGLIVLIEDKNNKGSGWDYVLWDNSKEHPDAYFPGTYESEYITVDSSGQKSIAYKNVNDPTGILGNLSSIEDEKEKINLKDVVKDAKVNDESQNSLPGYIKKQIQERISVATIERNEQFYHLNEDLNVWQDLFKKGEISSQALDYINDQYHKQYNQIYNTTNLLPSINGDDLGNLASGFLGIPGMVLGDIVFNPGKAEAASLGQAEVSKLLQDPYFLNKFMNYKTRSPQYVYVLLDKDGVVRYVGRTDDPTRRESEHLKNEEKSDLRMRVLTKEPVSYAEGRALEQYVYEQYSSNQLLNRIRPINIDKPWGKYLRSLADPLAKKLKI